MAPAAWNAVAARWDDILFAVLLLVVGVPRAVLALFFDRPLGAEGSLAIICVGLALVVLVVGRRRS